MSQVTLHEDLVVRVSRLVPDTQNPATTNIVILNYLSQVVGDRMKFLLSTQANVSVTTEIQR